MAVTKGTEDSAVYKKLTIGALLVLVLASLVGLVQTQQTSAAPAEEEKITICHRTNSVKNPYSMISVDQSAADGIAGNGNGNQPDHFGEHLGPVFDSNTTYPTPHNGDQWGDIIPPIVGVHNGYNWDTAGQAIYNNECTPTTPPSVTALVTFTAPTCKALGTYTIPTTEGVDYSINGAVVAAGDYTASNGSTVTVVATAQQGFVLKGTTEWTYTFTAPTCDENGQVLGSSTTTKPPTALPVTSGDPTVANVIVTSGLVSLVTLLSVLARSVLIRQV